MRREAASQKLIDAGPVAIPDLIHAVRDGDLEVVERAMNVITRIAIARPPQEDGGAWDRLSLLATKASGRAASSAAGAIEEIREHRATQAKAALAEAGVFVGPDEFVLRAVSQIRDIVQIDEKWDGEIESLHWLRWLRGIENARIKGAAVREDVLETVSYTHLTLPTKA